jgi:hypothetical protein
MDNSTPGGEKISSSETTASDDDPLPTPFQREFDTLFETHPPREADSGLLEGSEEPSEYEQPPLQRETRFFSHGPFNFSAFTFGRRFGR